MGGRYVPEDTPVGCLPVERAGSTPPLELFAEMIAGRLPMPPIARLMNFRLAVAREGFAEFRGVPLFDHYNPIGVVHGGWASTILDSALGCAVHTRLPVGMAYTTVEFKVNLVRPLTSETGEVVCRGEVVHFGRTMAVSEARLTSPDGARLYALGTETCAIFPFERNRR